jgi:glyoxalase-like protein
MSGDIGFLHHVGLVVRDMSEAMAVYRRAGFELDPPKYPALPQDDGTIKPFGVAQTAVRFTRGFVEIATIVNSAAPVPPDTELVPIQVPAEVLPQIKAVIGETVDRFTVMLGRYQGLHRLVFSTPDADAVAARFSAAGIGHSGVNTTQRPVETETGVQIETIRHLEIAEQRADGAGAEAPEALLAVAEKESLHGRRTVVHPNGATELVDTLLCVTDNDLASVVSRYETYLGRSAVGSGNVRCFELDGARLTVGAESALSGLLPGERPPGLPSLVAYTVEVADLDSTERWLRASQVPVARTAAGEPFIPSADALGAAIVFRPKG